MKDRVKRFLDKLPTEFKPVVEQATKYSYDDKAVVRKDGAVQIFNRTWVAPENYGLLLFPRADSKLINKFEKRCKLKTPQSYKKVLGIMNGCFIYDFALFGLPKSVYSTGLLNRNTLNQLDLGTANEYWKYEYQADTDNLFHIGGRAYSFDENIGYFMDSDGKILSLRKNGKNLKTWTSFREFLVDEIKAAERMMTKEIPGKFKRK